MIKRINRKPIAILIVVVGFLLLLKLQFPLYQVSGNSMSPALIKNDIVLVNKLLAEKNIKNNDIYVFSYHNEQHVSRIVGLPGDKLEIIDGVLFINNIEETEVDLSFAYKIILDDHPALAEYDILHTLKPVNQFEEYVATLTMEQVDSISQIQFVKSISRINHPKGYSYSFKENPIFPNRSSFNWSRDNFGPIIIPKKGDILGPNNYFVKNNYYFTLGDNRHTSFDSRFFGFVTENNLIGKMVVNIYSPNE